MLPCGTAQAVAIRRDTVEAACPATCSPAIQAALVLRSATDLHDSGGPHAVGACGSVFPPVRVECRAHPSVANRDVEVSLTAPSMQSSLCLVENESMGLFRRKETTKASKISAHARYVDAEIQRIDLTIKDVDGESVRVECTLDQVRQLIGELTIAYSACRPSLLSQKEADQIATRFGMR